MDSAPLFTGHRHLRPDIDAVLQGYCGTAIANTGGDFQAAQLSISVLTFFGGDPTHPMARHLVTQLTGEQSILVASEAWRTLIYHNIPRPWPPDYPSTTHRLLCQVSRAGASASAHERRPSRVSDHTG